MTTENRGESREGDITAVVQEILECEPTKANVKRRIKELAENIKRITKTINNNSKTNNPIVRGRNPHLSSTRKKLSDQKKQLEGFLKNYC